jgi:DNA-binding NtrC family response regulator
LPASDSNFAHKPAHLLTPHVLVVEDESRLRELLLDVIPDMGCTATAARSAEEAIRIIETDPPNIIMLDLQLPGMSGMELFERLHQQLPDMQVIIMTGFGDLESARQAIRMNVVDFIAKPFHLRDVELALDKARKRIPREKQRAEPLESTPQSPARTLADAERQMILAALERHGGNRTAAAMELGISRRKLHYWLRENKAEETETDNNL